MDMMAPLDDECVTITNKLKRKKHSTDAMLPTSLFTGMASNQIPTKTEFADLSMERKMNTIFDMMVNITNKTIWIS